MNRRPPAHAQEQIRTNRALIFIPALLFTLILTTWIVMKDGSGSKALAESQRAPETSVSHDAPQSDTGTPSACAAHFEGPGDEVAPVELVDGELYPDLPIPSRDSYVFAGWYQTPEAAETLDTSQRVNMARMVDCGTPIQFTSGWVTPEENAAEATEVPILMYHFLTTYPGEAQEKARPNLYVEPTDFDEQISYIKDTGFYLPSWKELSAFIDGELYLPQRSVIITADDGHRTWWEIGVPILDGHGVMSTAFLISGRDVGPDGFPYVLRRSHTSSMHSLDGGSEGRMVRWSEEEIRADLETSAAELGGVTEVLAYPFGQTNDIAKSALTATGFEMGRLAGEGYVTIGTEKLALPIILVGNGDTAADLAQKIG